MKYFKANFKYKSSLRGLFDSVKLSESHFFVVFDKECLSTHLVRIPEPSDEDKLLLILAGDIWEFDFRF